VARNCPQQTIDIQQFEKGALLGVSDLKLSVKCEQSKTLKALDT
jgi:hypothetical protein